MKKRLIGEAVALLAFVAAAILGNQPVVFAQQASSTNYSVDNAFFGNGGQLGVAGDGCSTNYCAKSAAGEMGVGNVSSTNYQQQAGTNTERTPYLEVHVNTANVNLGTQSVSTASTGSGVFTVKTYLASGYAVQNGSDPPADTGPNAHTFPSMSTAAASSPGTEQFGINLVANTTACGAPANYGADPVQVPSSSFSYGYVTSGYNTCGQYKYVKGDIIARSNQSTGETDFTVSYMMNISNITPAGTYNFNHDLVVTSTF